MDLKKQSLIEYEYFKLAKRIETFAFKAHFVEISYKRIEHLIFSLNDCFSDSGYSDMHIDFPYELEFLASDFHWK